MVIEIYRDMANQFRWRRVSSDNGQVTVTGESHRRKWNAKRAARKAFPDDPIVDRTKKR